MEPSSSIGLPDYPIRQFVAFGVHKMARYPRLARGLILLRRECDYLLPSSAKLVPRRGVAPLLLGLEVQRLSIWLNAANWGYGRDLHSHSSLHRALSFS